VFTAGPTDVQVKWTGHKKRRAELIMPVVLLQTCSHTITYFMIKYMN